MSYLWTALCFLGCLPLLYVYLHQYGTLLAPAALFTSVWLITIGLFELEFVRYIQIDATTWAMLAASCLCFLLGCLFAHLFAGSDRIVPEAVPGFEAEERRLLWTLAITVPLGVVGVVMYVMIVGRTLGYEVFVQNPYLVRDLQASDAFRAAFRWPRFLNYLNILNVAIGAYYVVRYRGVGATKMVFLAMLLGFATTLLGMDRTLPFAALAWSFFTAEFARVEGRGARGMLTRLAVLGATMVVIFVTVGQVLGKTLENNRDADSSVVVAPEYRPLIMPYIYLTANIPAFQEFVHHTEGGSTKGVFLLLPAAKLAQTTVAPNVRIPDEVGDYYSVPFAFNTHTWLDVYWSDFGYVGLLFVPLMMGFGSTVLFLRALRRPTFRNAILSGLSSYVAINTVFVNKLISTPMWEFVFIILLVSWGLTDDRPSAEAAT